MVDENYVDLYKDTEDEKEGIEIAGKDVILLDAPEVLLSPDTPLLTTAQDVAGAINELFSSGGEGGDDKWIRPFDWPELGTPGDNEIIFLVTAQNLSMPSVNFALYANHSGSSGRVLSGSVIVDWGDGETETIDLSGTQQNISHNYYDYEPPNPPSWHPGKVLSNGAHVFVIKTTLPDDAYFDSSQSDVFLDMHIGRNIKFYNYLDYFRMLEHIKFFDWIPTEDNYFPSGYNGLLYAAQALRSVETTMLWKKVTAGMFNRCYSLDDFNFTECEEIASYGFYECTRLAEINAPELSAVESNSFNSCYKLKKVNAPKLKSVGTSAFYNCSNLETVSHAENWTYASNSFSYCYKYYDNPNMQHPKF